MRRAVLPPPGGTTEHEGMHRYTTRVYREKPERLPRKKTLEEWLREPVQPSRWAWYGVWWVLFWLVLAS